MKSAVLVLASLLALSACGDDDTTPGSDSGASDAETMHAAEVMTLDLATPVKASPKTKGAVTAAPPRPASVGA